MRGKTVVDERKLKSVGNILIRIRALIDFGNNRIEPIGNQFRSVNLIEITDISVSVNYRSVSVNSVSVSVNSVSVSVFRFTEPIY